MSSETHAALEDAIRAHVADIQDGEIVTDWALITASTAFENIGTMRLTYGLEAPEQQPQHVTIGLLEYARQTYLESGDDDE